jgi:hypothetical protein
MLRRTKKHQYMLTVPVNRIAAWLGGSHAFYQDGIA